MGSYKQGETPPRMQVRQKLVPGSRAEKASGAGYSSFLMDQFLHLERIRGGQGSSSAHSPRSPPASARRRVAIRRALGGPARRHPSAPTPTYGSDPRHSAPAQAARPPQSPRSPVTRRAHPPWPQPGAPSSPHAGAGTCHPATVPAFFVARSVPASPQPLGPTTRPALHHVSRAGLLPFFFRPRPAR